MLTHVISRSRNMLCETNLFIDLQNTLLMEVILLYRILEYFVLYDQIDLSIFLLDKNIQFDVGLDKTL